MKKFHISENGAKECNAKINECPITAKTGGQHYNTYEEAQSVFEKSNKSFTKLQKAQKTYAPFKPEIAPPTMDEANKAIARLDAHLRESNPKKYKPIDFGKVQGYVLLGSGLYGLNHETSDRDLMIITDKVPGADVKKVFDDGEDLWITSTTNFLDNYYTQHTHIDIAQSGKLIMAGSFSQMFKNLRFGRAKYLSRAVSHFEQDTLSATGLRENPKRADKALKTALRTAIMIERVYYHGNDYHVEFTDEERELFYKSYKKIRDNYWSNENIDDVDSVRASISNEVQVIY